MEPKEKFENRIKRYLGLEASSSNFDFHSPFLRLTEAFERSVVFGGTIRDIVLSDPGHKPADIDVVVDADESELLNFFSTIPHRTNRFGGFRFEYNRQLYDVWCLKNTWAASIKYFEDHSFDSLLSSTFFNIDAAYYGLHDGKIHAHDSFFKDLEKRKLDINFAPNPNPEGMVRRALRYAIKRDFSLSPRLVEFILDNLTSLVQTEFGYDVSKKLFHHISNRSKHFCELHFTKRNVYDYVKEMEDKKSSSTYIKHSSIGIPQLSIHQFAKISLGISNKSLLV